MKTMTSKQIRQKWLDFFSKKEHMVLPSKSLIPINDPSLLWINSGVATLKDYFSGVKIPPSPRLTNSQKSIRTNDIENVGITARHHTFFEMLGNFSIGDYFKSSAIEFAYEFLIDELKLEKDKLYFTYYEEDIETYNKWISLGIEESHLIVGDKAMNFWDVGQGPCGPDTEVFYDRGSKYDPKNIGIKLLQEDIENDRYIEIWNIVFSEFNNDGEGNYTTLKQQNIDTGAGLERIVSIFQDAPTNFDTDLFLPIIKKVEDISGAKYDTNNYFEKPNKQTIINKNFKIIADHIRAVVMAIADGAKPSNTSRGYIIRRLIRRAYKSGLTLGVKEQDFLTKLIPVVAEVLDVYPFDIEKVSKVILKEELAFAKTIKQGEELLEKSIKGKKELDFAIAFKLFETYGFPIELTRDILEEKNIYLDISQFDKFKKDHANVSRGDKNVSGMKEQINIIQNITSHQSKFIGYDHTKIESEIIFSGSEKGKYYTITKMTPFYATGGGQEHDKGTINGIEVIDVIKDKYGNHWHVTGAAIEGVNANLEVDQKIRLDKERNHSATHLLGNALRAVIGNSVVQMGSYNDEFKLRFDFPSDIKPSKEQIKEVEQHVNAEINKNHQRLYIETTNDKAKEMGAITLEGEEYGNDVRVVHIGPSIEFCGGTHVHHSGLIEKFKIVKIESKGSGVFRIEGITSLQKVDEYLESQKNLLISELKRVIAKNQGVKNDYSLNIPNDIEMIEKAISQAKKDNKNLQKTHKNLKIDIENIDIKEIDGIPTYISLSEDSSNVKVKAITLREKFPHALIIIGAKHSKGMLVACASKAFDANKELKKRYPNVRGGGNENFAMGSVINA